MSFPCYISWKISLELLDDNKIVLFFLFTFLGGKHNLYCRSSYKFISFVVYAIEASQIALEARKVIAANKMSDRIEIIHAKLEVRTTLSRVFG